MMDVPDQPTVAPPGGDELGDVGFRAQIVARTPGRIEKALLNVDYEQGGVGRQHRPGPRKVGMIKRL